MRRSSGSFHSLNAIACAVALVVAARAHAGAAGSSASLDAVSASNAIATKALAAQRIPGLAIAIVRHGKIVMLHGYGVADKAKRTAVLPETRFEIGSITKQFTAAAILQLIAAKRLTLDDRLGAFVPGYTAAKDVTIRQMLLQTSGIPEYLGETDFQRPPTAVTLQTILDRVGNNPLDFPPGTKWKYSNTNYWLLGLIVARASALTYEEYVRRHLFAPAGMTHSGFISDERRLPHMATGYVTDKGAVRSSPPMPAALAGGAGEIVADAGDMVRWDAALLGGKIISPQDVTLMRTSGTTSDGKPTGYGFGWVIDTLASHPQIWHNGGTFGFHASNNTYPADDERIIVLANLADATTETIASDLFAAAHPDVKAALTSPAAGEKPDITARVREWLRRFQKGDIDRAQLSASMNAALTPQLVEESKTQLGPLGDPTQMVYRGATPSGDGTVYAYRATFAAGSFTITMAIDKDGKIAGYRIRP